LQLCAEWCRVGFHWGSDIVPREAPSSHTEVSRSSYGTKRHASLSAAKAPSRKKIKLKGSDSDSSIDLATASDSDVEIVQTTAQKKDKPWEPPRRKKKEKGEHAALALKAKKSHKSAAKDEEGSDDNAPYKNSTLVPQGLPFAPRLLMSL
jgi:hypothetical protein